MAKDHISPSQLSEAADCLRKWGYKSIEGLAPPAAASAQFGTDTHAYLERYYRSFGEHLPDPNDNPGRAAMAGLEIIPKPQPLSPTWPGPEFRFEFSLGPVRYKGTIDLMYQENDCAVVLDHKTSSDPRKWGKTPEDLAEDYQRVIYSVAALRHFDTSFVRARWIYYRSRPPYEAFEVSFGPESADATLLRFEKIHVTATELVRLRSKYRAADLPKNEASCDKYGGCPFRQRCSKEGAAYNARERLNGIGETKMANSLLEQLRNGGKPTTPEHAPPPAAAAAEEKPSTIATTIAPPSAGKSSGGLLGMFTGGEEKPAAKLPPPRVAETMPITDPNPTGKVGLSADNTPAARESKPITQVPVTTDSVGRMAAMTSDVLSQINERLAAQTLSNAELISLLGVLMG